MILRKLIVIAIVTFYFQGCDKLSELTKFDLVYNSRVVIESTGNINLPFDIVTPDVETNSESEFAINDTRKDLIEEVKLKELQLEILTPSDGNFSFLESVEIFITAEGLSEVSIASSTDISASTGNILNLDVSDVDIKEYIKKDKFKLRLNTITDEVIRENHEIDVKSVFKVDAKILGL